MAVTAVEQALVEHVERGEVLDLAGDGPVDEAAMRAWDDSRTVSAGVIRDIVRGKRAEDPDPHGLRLRGARIKGRLDLENITSAVAIELEDCLLDQGVNARDANLTFLDLSGCQISHSTEPALDASRLTATILGLVCATCEAGCARGSVTLDGAHLRSLDCSGGRLSNDSGPAMFADGLQVNQGVFLGTGFVAAGSARLGAIRLLDAHIGLLIGSGARLSNDSGPALCADRLQVDRDVYINKGFVGAGSGELGAVQLGGCHIGGVLDCSGARLSNDAGPALDADHLWVDQSVFLRDRFVATGSGGSGVISLVGGRIGGQLECSGARLSNDSGPALCADRLRVDQSVLLRDGFVGAGSGESGAVRLLGAHVSGQLSFSGARLSNDSGPALNVEHLQVDRKMFLSNGFEAVGGGQGVVLDLTNMAVGGNLYFSPDKVKHQTDSHARLRLDGMVYAGLPGGISSADWLALLRDGTPEYAAQPYQHLAAAHRAAGHDREARRVLIAQRRDQINRHAVTGRGERAWAQLTGVLLGYGYQPWRALIGLLAVITTAVVLSVVLGGQGALAQVRNPPPPAPVSCTWVERVGVGLDLGTPLVTTNSRTRCDTTNTTNGQVLTATGWVLRLLAWAFATLFIAGFTGAIRKT